VIRMRKSRPPIARNEAILVSISPRSACESNPASAFDPAIRADIVAPLVTRLRSRSWVPFLPTNENDTLGMTTHPIDRLFQRIAARRAQTSASHGKLLASGKLKCIRNSARNHRGKPCRVARVRRPWRTDPPMSFPSAGALGGLRAQSARRLRCARRPRGQSRARRKAARKG
jgi:hypothetical protein